MRTLYLNLLLDYRCWRLKRTLRELARLTLLTRNTTDTETVTQIDVKLAEKPPIFSEDEIKENARMGVGV